MYILVRVSKPENQEPRCPRAGEDTRPSSRRESELPALSLPFCYIRALNEFNDVHPQWSETIFFTQSVESNANLFEEHSHICFTSYVDIH